MKHTEYIGPWYGDVSKDSSLCHSYRGVMPFDCLNINELFCPQPLPCKNRMQFHATYTECINQQCDDACEFLRGCISYSGVIVLVLHLNQRICSFRATT